MPSDTSKTNPKKDPYRLRTLIIALFGLSVCLIFARNILRDSDAFPTGDSVWRMNYVIEIINSEPQALVHIPIPNETKYTRIVKQVFFHPDASLRRVVRNKRPGAHLVAEIHGKGQYKLALDFLIQVSDSFKLRTANSSPKSSKSIEQLQNYLQNNLPVKLDDKWIEYNMTQTSKNAKDKKDYILKINQLVKNLVQSPLQSRNLQLTAYDRAILLTAFCRANQIPARVITGVLLKESIDSKLHYWVEIYAETDWEAYDPTFGFNAEVPRNYLPLKFKHEHFMKATGTQQFTFGIDISEVHDASGMISPNEKSFWRIFDLTRLPRDLQDDLMKLMLLPFAVLLTAMIRHLAGIRCYGTFTPALLAFALTYLSWSTAFFLFMLVTFVAFAGRRFMPNSMNRVPRLSIVFTLVALGLGLGLSILDYISLSTVNQGVLLPIVILTSLIDRLYTTWEVEGKHTAMIRLVWTVSIAILCIPLVNFNWLGYQALVYPEMHFSTIACILILYSYSGPVLAKKWPIPWIFETPKSKNGTETMTVSQPRSLEP